MESNPSILTGVFLSQHKGFKIIGQNARSLPANMIKMKIHLTDFDVLCVSESWLKEKHDLSETHWVNNDSIRLDRPTERAGGLRSIAE